MWVCYTAAFTMAIMFPHPRVTKPNFYICETLIVTVLRIFRLVYEKSEAFNNSCKYVLIICWKCHVWTFIWVALAILCLRATLSDMISVTSRMCREKAGKQDIMRSLEVCFISSDPVSQAEHSQSMLFRWPCPFLCWNHV